MMPTAKPLQIETIKEFPTLIYTTTAIKTLLCMLNTTHAKTKEFMFLGDVSKIGKDYVVSRFHLVPQTNCSATYCETDDERYPEWLAKNIPINQRKYIRLHGHSHVNMSTTPSGVDDEQIKKLCDNVSDYFIQLIVNHNLENTVNIWDKQNNLIYSNVEQYIMINQTLIKLTSRTKIQFLMKAIKNGKYEVKDNRIKIEEGIYLNVLTGNYQIEDDNITIICNEDIKVKNPKDEEFTLMENKSKEMIKSFTYAPSYWQATPQNYPQNRTAKYNWEAYDYPDYYAENDDFIINYHTKSPVKNYFSNDFYELPDNFLDKIKDGSIEVDSLIYMGKTYNRVKTNKGNYVYGNRKFQHKTTKEYIVTEDEKYYNDNNYTYVGSWCTLVNKFIPDWEGIEEML